MIFTRKSKIKIYTFGQFSNRIPFNYPDYFPYFESFFEYVDSPKYADFLVCGFFGDIKNFSGLVSDTKVGNPNIQLVVFSEEPLWDTLWYYKWEEPIHNVKVAVNGVEEIWSFHFLNHANTDLYDFVNIPYFLTTTDHYIQRYIYLLNSKLKLATKEILSQWKESKFKYTFIAEKRLRQDYSKYSNDGLLLGLSVYRTEVASVVADRSNQCICIGKGWNTEESRQGLPDWHLDKIVYLNKTGCIVSAIENTALNNYVSEKPFDVITTGSIPVYWLTDEHRLADMIDHDSILNIANMSVQEASEHILNFEPVIPHAESIQESQRKLLKVFSKRNVLADERHIFAAKSYLQFSDLMNF